MPETNDGDRMRFLLRSLLWTFIVRSQAWNGEFYTTSVTDDLNSQILEGDCGVYCGGGKGVIIRNPYDGYELGGPSSWKVVPSTFWHNDLAPANGIFPSTMGAGPFGSDGWGVTSYNVDCPNSGNNGFFDIGPNCDPDPGTGHTSPWRYASTGYLLGDAMDNVMPDWKNSQDNDWGWGVFYPTDSNSVDFRCKYLDDYGGYDCPPDPGLAWPGGWIADGAGWVQDDTNFGPGSYPAGNPYADKNAGGGSGCHLDKAGKMLLDQTDAYADGLNLVGDVDCQCNYVFRDDWSHWVQTWINHAEPKDGLGFENWLGGGPLAPNRALDQVSCWVNNFRDMINIQNELWYYRWSWNNQQAPQQSWEDKNPNSFWGYWGWNEIPMALADLTPPENHQTIFIHLPTSICGHGGGDDSVDCLEEGQQWALENDLDNWVNGKDGFGYLVPGSSNIGNRPGSYIVFVRQWYSVDEDRWRKYFFCENWEGRLGKYKIVAIPWGGGDDGACYVDYGHQYHRFYGNLTNVGQLRHTMDEFV